MSAGVVRNLLRISVAVAVAVIVLLYFVPVHSKLVNLGFVLIILATWAGLLVLNWKRRFVRYGLIVVAGIAAIPFLLPGRAIDAEQLRSDYVERLSNYEGIKYYWGGESSRGIDCSGLPRRALRDSLFWYGIKNLNGRAFRMYAEQWWFDASAGAIQSGYRDYAVKLTNEGVLRVMSYDGLLPGDLAVTKNGVHMLAYVGDNKWIQADPGQMKVACQDGRKEKNAWFKSKVTTHRWTVLK